MIYILLSILCSSTISVVMKISDRHRQSGYAILCVNYIFATVFSLISALIKEPLTGMTPAFWGIGLVTGVFFLAAFVLNQYSICQNGAVLSAVFMKMGILIPLLLSLLLWHEQPTLFQILGVILAVSAILIMTVQGGKKTGKRVQTLWVLPILLVLAGTADSMSKFYTLYGVESLNEWYMVLTFFTALVLCFPMMVRNGEHFNREKMGLGSILGLVNYAGTWFMLLAVRELPTYLVYPMVNTGIIAVVTIISLLVFKEQLKKRQIFGLVLVAGAVILLNL